MRARTPLAASTLALTTLAAAPALAQTSGTATYHIDVENPVLAPGQSTWVHVHVSFDPGIGQVISTPQMIGPVIGLSDGAFSIAGFGVPGTWNNVLQAAPYGHPHVPGGTPSGLNVNNILWGLGFLLTTNHPSPENPDHIWSGTFKAGQTPGTVTLSTTNLAVVGVFFGGPIPAVALYQPNPGPGAQITIIPAPASAALTVAGLMSLSRRRR